MKNSAGFWIRIVAFIVDLISLATLSYFLVSGLILLNREQEVYLEFYIIMCLVLLIYINKTLVPAFWKGQTIGKRMLGIQIRKINGQKMNAITFVLRHTSSALILTLLIYLPLKVFPLDQESGLIGTVSLLGIVMIGISYLLVNAFMIGLRKDKRSIRDFIAGTYVSANFKE